MAKYLVTGGNGQLGRALQPLMSDAVFLGKEDLNVLDWNSIRDAVRAYDVNTILHLAAYTNVAKAEIDRETCHKLNVGACERIADVALSDILKIIYISTDYVFDGENGAYTPSSPKNPINWYGKTKALGEEAIEKHPWHLIIRTSFKPVVFPHPKAFEDLWTSADYVDVIAPMIVDNLSKSGIIHVGTERKTIYDLIKRRNPHVQPMLRSEVSVPLPRDVSFG